METERWRYVTTKECREALGELIPSEWDSRAMLKKGLITSIDALREEFASTLGVIAKVSMC
jgi:hypothetical protein